MNTNWLSNRSVAQVGLVQLQPQINESRGPVNKMNSNNTIRKKLKAPITFYSIVTLILASTFSLQSLGQDWQTSSNGSQYRIIYGDFSHGRDPNGPGYDGFALEKDYFEVEEDRKEKALRARNEIAQATSRAMQTAGTIQGQRLHEFLNAYRYFIRLTYFNYTPAMLAGDELVPYSMIATTQDLPDIAKAILLGVDQIEKDLTSDTNDLALKNRFPKLAQLSQEEFETAKLHIAEAYAKVTVPFFLEIQDMVFKKERVEKSKPGLIGKGEAALIHHQFSQVRKDLAQDPLSLAILLYAQRISLESPKSGREIPNDKDLNTAVSNVYKLKNGGANYKKVLTPQFLASVTEWAYRRSAGQFDFYTTTSNLERILKPFLITK